jgi:GntR family transcriptional regulator / MocR family aminotransferase
MARRAPRIKILQPQLVRNSTVALHRQLYCALRDALVRGDACPGERLPSTRVLSRALGVSRNTVLNAYDELAAEGLVVGRRGSGTRVAAPDSALRGVSGSVRREWAEQTRGARRSFDWPALLRESQYPLHRIAFTDPDGTPLILFDSRPSAA